LLVDEAFKDLFSGIHSPSFNMFHRLDSRDGPNLSMFSKKSCGFLKKNEKKREKAGKKAQSPTP
ncbi:MAG: hypothetical protein J6W70_02475, partial [Lentisphaeria bacterium]|nr:hypothetical protein [Lentisphaeria bacterium]